jgi:O-antigen/teichoic acid export membrane protein
MAKDLFKSSIAYTILGFLPLSFALVFTPIYTTYLNPEQYGILNLFVLYTSIFAQIIGLGIGRGFLYHYWDVYKDSVKLKELISSTLGMLLILQFIFIGLGIIFGDNILDFILKSKGTFSYNPLFILTLFQSAFLIYHEMFGYFFRNEGKLKEYSILSAGTLILLTLGSIIGVIYLDLKAEGAIFGRTFGYGTITLFFLISLIKKYGINFSWRQSKVLVIFSIPIFINAFIGSLSHGVDKIIIERLDSLQNLGVYGFALVFVSILEIWLNSINNALSPTIYKYMNESIEKKRREIEGLLYIIITSIFILIGLMLAFLYPALELLFPKEYHEITSIIPILVCAFIWRVYTSIVLYPIYIKKKTRLLLYNETSVLLFIVCFGYLGYNLLGLKGIVLGIYAVKVLEYLIMRYLSNKTMKIPINLSQFYILTCVLSIVCFIVSFIDKSGLLNKYVLFSIPLVTILVGYPLLLKEELIKIKFVFKNRKKLFDEGNP